VAGAGAHMMFSAGGGAVFEVTPLTTSCILWFVITNRLDRTVTWCDL